MPDARTDQRRDSGSPPRAVLFGITATGIMANSLINASIPDIVTGLGASTSAAGLVLGAGTLPGIVLAPVIGIMADAYGRRRVILPCLWLFAVAGILAGLAPNLPVLILGRFLQGVGSAGLINLVVVLIGDHYDEGRRAAVIGQNSAVLTTCLAIYPPLGGLLTDTISFRAPFALYALAAVTALAAAKWLPDDAMEEDIDLRRRLTAARPVLAGRPIIGVLIAGTVVFALIFGLILTTLPIYLDDAFGLSAGQRGLALSGASVFNTIAALSSGRLAGWLSLRGRVTIGAAAFAMGLVIVGAAPTLLWMAPAVVLVGVGEGMLIPTLQDAAASGPTETRGTVVAVFVGLARLGQTIGPVAASTTLVVLGAPTQFFLAAGVALAGGVAIRPLLVASPADSTA